MFREVFYDTSRWLRRGAWLEEKTTNLAIRLRRSE
jgi:hypothetical protein